MADPCNRGGATRIGVNARRRSGWLRIGYCNSANNLDRTAQNKRDNDLALYREAREGGLEPKTTQCTDVIANDGGRRDDVRRHH